MSEEDIPEFRDDDLKFLSPLESLQQNEEDSTRFPLDKQSISEMCLAVAQANLVQQTQQDIIRMFSLDFCEKSENKVVQQTSGEESQERELPDVSLEEPHTPAEGCFSSGCHKCEICERTFSSPGYLKKHKIVHENALVCHYVKCCRKFSSPSHLKYHLLTHQDTRQYKCTFDRCTKSFLTPQQLAVHTRTHTGERPFKCDSCQKPFSTAGNLRNHIRTHTGDKPFECTECSLRFAEQSSLKKHSLVHTGEKPHKCPVCQRCFTQVGSMRVHMRKHDTEERIKKIKVTSINDDNNGTKAPENSGIEQKRKNIYLTNPPPSSLLFIIPHVQLLETSTASTCEKLTSLTDHDIVDGCDFLYADHEEVVFDTPYNGEIEGD